MVKLIASLAVAALVAGCATSTAPGAVGVTRSQLMIVSSDAINQRAASEYMQLSSEASKLGRLNADPVLTARVKSVADRLIKQVGPFRPDASTWSWEINVIQSDKLNAFCMPGGPRATTGSTVAANATPSTRGAGRQAARTNVIESEAVQVERMARARLCNETPIGNLTWKGPDFETYEVACNTGKPLLFRCEFSNCVGQN